MLRKLLATSALVVIGAVLIQTANAAEDLKTRQIVVEPAGSHAPDAAGLPAAGKIENLIVQPGSGTATPTQTADAGGAAAAAANSAAIGNKTPVDQLLVTPPSGGATPPTVVADPAGTATATPGTPPAGATPVTPAVPVAPAATPAVPATATPAAPAVAAGPAGPAATPAPAAAAVKSADDLEKLLTGHGYGVEVSKHDADGNEIFYVTIPGDTQNAYLLTVDEYGKVKETKHVSSYGYGHSYSAPSYGSAYGSDDNCDYGTGYSTGY